MNEYINLSVSLFGDVKYKGPPYSQKDLPFISFSTVKVLRILEGDLVMDSNYLSTPGYDVGNRSGRMWTEQQQQQQQQNYSRSLSDETLERFNEKVCIESFRPGYWERDKTRRTSRGSDL